MKFYSINDGAEILRHRCPEDCLEEVAQYLYDEDLGEDWEEMIVYEFISRSKRFDFCSYHDYFDPSCGKHECSDYLPRNGKSGICKHASKSLELSGRQYILKPDGSYKLSKGKS